MSIGAPRSRNTAVRRSGTTVRPTVDGDDIRIYDDAGTKYGAIEHDGTDVVITSSSGDLGFYVGGARRVTFASSGNVGVGVAAAADIRILLSPGATTEKGLVVKGLASQTANLIEAQDSNGDASMTVGFDGRVTTPLAILSARLALPSPPVAGSFAYYDDDLYFGVSR